ncbi:MotE family protein [Neobacillus sp. K501]
MVEKKSRSFGPVLLWGTLITATVVVALIALNFLGYPIAKTALEWGNKIPVVNGIIPDVEKETSTVQDSTSESEDADYLQQQYSQLEAQLAEKDKEISELKKEISTSEKSLEESKKNNEELLKQLQNNQSNEEDKEQENKIAEIYGNIPASKAAKMIETMSLEEAALTISQLEQEHQSSILGSMKDAQKAAQITLILKDMP